MKKMLTALILAAGIFLTACGEDSEASEGQAPDAATASMEDIPGSTATGETAAEDFSAAASDTEEAVDQTDDGQERKAEKAPGEDENGVVDLTKLSSTMVFSEVYSMMTDPTPYIGKTIVMNGQFTVYQDPETGKLYFSCIIKDASACCAQGIEFSLAGDHEFPEDYPQEGDNITVQGTFDIYTEGQAKYMQLADSVLLNS